MKEIEIIENFEIFKLAEIKSVFAFPFDYWKIYFMSLFETKNEFNESAF